MNNDEKYFKFVDSCSSLSFPRRRESIVERIIIMIKQYYVYILANKKNGTIYIGVTNNLKRRVGEHKEDIIEGFTKKYRIHNLVYFESYNDIKDALTREKRLKKWNRKWKIKLIEEMNPDWCDLYNDLF